MYPIICTLSHVFYHMYFMICILSYVLYHMYLITRYCTYTPCTPRSAYVCYCMCRVSARMYSTAWAGWEQERYILLYDTVHTHCTYLVRRMFATAYVRCQHFMCTGWRRLIGSPKLQITFHHRVTKYRSLLRKMTYKDKGSYKSSPPCIHSTVRYCTHTPYQLRSVYVLYCICRVSVSEMDSIVQYCIYTLHIPRSAHVFYCMCRVSKTMCIHTTARSCTYTPYAPRSVCVFSCMCRVSVSEKYSTVRNCTNTPYTPHLFQCMYSPANVGCQ